MTVGSRIVILLTSLTLGIYFGLAWWLGLVQAFFAALLLVEVPALPILLAAVALGAIALGLRQGTVEQ